MQSRQAVCNLNFARLLGQASRPKQAQPHVLRLTVSDSVLKSLGNVGKRYISLRPYQEESIQAVLSHLNAGHKRLGLSLATGSGKTVIFTQLIDRIKPTRHESSRTLVLAHRRELVEQAYRHCSNAYPDLKVEVDMGDIQASGTADITIASVPSLRKDRLMKYDPSRFKLVLVDEAHHVVAKSYLRILQHFGLTAPDTKTLDGGNDAKRGNVADFKVSEDAPVLVGVSATFSRFDGLSIGHAIDFIVYHKDYVELIDEKWLSNVVFTTVDFKANLNRVKRTSDGDFLTSSLSEAVNTDATNEIVIRTWLLKATKRRSTLVFCVDIAHVEDLCRKFVHHGIEARSITAKTSVSDRAATIEAFRNGRFPVLLNCGIFTEGTDIPNIDCVLLARPTRSRNLLVQMVGRGMRLHSGKQDCHVIDMVSALSSGITTVPTLFGLDPTVLLEKASVSDMKALQQRPPSQLQHIGADPAGQELTLVNHEIQLKDYDSIEDLLVDTSGEEHIRQVSYNAWVHVGPDAEGHDRHVLSGSDLTYLTIKDLNAKDPRYVVYINERVPGPSDPTEDINRWSPYKRSVEVAWANTLGDAVRAADTYAASHHKFPRVLINRNLPWLRRPLSERQAKCLKVLEKSNKLLDPSRLNAGQARDILIKLKFGARGQWKALSKSKAKTKKEIRSLEQLKKLKERETVRVGPLS